ncbi:hypothetical protein SCUP515_12858 [Seiridium cupressi]
MRFILPVILFLAELVRSDQPSVAAGRFINPANAPDTPATYGKNALWTVGEVQTIKFTTTYSNYTIALWQQSIEGGSALLGPVIFQTQTSVFPQFDWVVQSFDFDLTLSPVFFLWLHAGTASDQGAPESLSVSSTYFNITIASASSASTSTLSSSKQVPSPKISATTTQQVVSATPTSNSSPSSQAAQLSTGARAGIGVGTSVAGLLALAIGAFCYLKRRKMNSPDRDESVLSKYAATGTARDTEYENPVWRTNTAGPAELESSVDHYTRGSTNPNPVELG